MAEALENLLKYQEIDRDVYRVENELRKSNEVQRVTLLQTKIQNCTQGILKLDKEAADLMALAEKYDSEVDSVLPSERANQLASCTDPKQVESWERVLKKCSEIEVNMEKELRRIGKRLQEIQKEAYQLNEEGKKYNADYKAAKEAYAKKSMEMRASVQAKVDELNKLKADIPVSLMEAYKKRRDARKFPAFVPYSKGNCGACGMDISAEVGQKLNAKGDLAECPSCHRVVYLKD